ELGRGHVEQVVGDDDEMRRLRARLFETFAAGHRGDDDRVAPSQDRLLKKQRAARVIDEEDASRLLFHAAEISRSFATMRFASSTNISTCASVFDLPRPMRIELSAASSGTPIAVRIGDAPR